MLLHIAWIKWDSGAALAYQTKPGACNWAYCGGGPSFRGVSPQHLVAAVESLLGWDHPAAADARAFARSAS